MNGFLNVDGKRIPIIFVSYGLAVDRWGISNLTLSIQTTPGLNLLSVANAIEGLHEGFYLTIVDALEPEEE